MARPTAEPGRGWASAAVAAWAIATLLLTLIPSPGGLASGIGDGFGHAIIGAITGASLLCLIRSWMPTRRLRSQVGVAAIVAAGFLATTEGFQYLVEARQPSWDDAAADAVGLVGALAVLTVAFSAGVSIRLWASWIVVASTLVAGPAATASVFLGPSERVTPSSAWPAVAGVTDSCVRHFGPTVSTEASRTDAGAVSEEDLSATTLLTVDLAVDPVRVEGALTPLALETVGGPTRVPGAGLSFAGAEAALRSIRPASGLVETLVTEDEFTVEVWFRADRLDRRGPDRLVTLSDGTARDDLVFHLGVQADQLSVRLATDCQPNWFLVGELTTAPTHAAVTYRRGQLYVYLDGIPVAQATLAGGGLAGWDRSVPLTIGNEATGDRAFPGTISAVGFHRLALLPDQIADLAHDPERHANLDAPSP